MLAKQGTISSPAKAILIILGFFAFIGWLSIRRYLSFNSSMLDLGNVTQAVWSATRGQPLVYTGVDGPVSRLLVHMELFYFLLAIFYRIFPSPVTLLVIQSALYAAGGWPVYQLASRKLGRPAYGLAAMSIYLLFPVAQTAALFDIHGDTLAMPLVLFAIDAADQQRWKRFALFSILAASCKLYAVLAIFLLAGLLFLKGSRKAAFYTAAACAVWAAGLLLLRFGLAHWAGLLAGQGTAAGQSLDPNQGFLGYLRFYFLGIFQMQDGLELRLVNALIVILPALALGWRSFGWFLAAWAFILPALLIREQGSNYIFHHYALAVPFLMASIIYGLAALVQRMQKRDAAPQACQRALNLNLAFTLILTLAESVLLVQTPLGPLFYMIPYVSTNEIPAQAFTSRDNLKSEILKQVPAGEPVWVNGFLAPRLVERPEIYVTRYEMPVSGEQMNRIAGRANTFVEDIFNQETNLDALSLVARSPQFHLQYAQDGFFVFNRQQPGLPYSIQPVPGLVTSKSDRRSAVSDSIQLVNYTVESIQGHILRFQFDWLLTSPLDPAASALIVTRLKGTQDMRIVHLPSLVLTPVDQWKPGEVYRETFTIQLPGSLPQGIYSLITTWQNRAGPSAWKTGEDSQIGRPVDLGSVEVK